MGCGERLRYPGLTLNSLNINNIRVLRTKTLVLFILFYKSRAHVRAFGSGSASNVFYRQKLNKVNNKDEIISVFQLSFVSFSFVLEAVFLGCP
jgi:hypothetical protein